MPTQREIPYDSGHFFITFTCYKWLPLIEVTNSYDLVYKWFDYLKQQGHYITGYVIMPNHVHATIAFTKTKKSINKIIGDGKRFIAYDIIKRLKENNQTDLLQQLESGVNKSDKRRGKLHEVWEDTFDWKHCYSNEFTIQKLDYMHNNPCKGKWHLAPSTIEYIHSSAKYYITAEQGIYEVLHFRNLEDMDLTKPAVE